MEQANPEMFKKRPTIQNLFEPKLKFNIRVDDSDEHSTRCNVSSRTKYDLATLDAWNADQMKCIERGEATIDFLIWLEARYVILPDDVAGGDDVADAGDVV